MEIKVSDLTNLSLMTVSCILLIKTTEYQSDTHSCQPQDSGIQITDVQDVHIIRSVSDTSDQYLPL